MPPSDSETPKKRAKKIKKAHKKLTPKQKEYGKARKKGIPAVDAYQLAGYKGQPCPENVAKIESRYTAFLITRVDALRLGRRASKKIFKDYLDDKAAAHVPAVVKLIGMQQDRIDPAVHKIEANTSHTSISIEIQAAVSADYQAMLEDAQVLDMPALEPEGQPKTLGTEKAQAEEAELVKP